MTSHTSLTSTPSQIDPNQVAIGVLPPQRAPRHDLFLTPSSIYL